LRLAAKDYYSTLPKDRPDDILNKATPYEWMMSSNAKMALVLLSMDQQGPSLSSQLKAKLYTNDRNPNKIAIYDTSNFKIGKNSFQDKLKCLRNINFNWV